jgi:uridylate kinase
MRVVVRIGGSVVASPVNTELMSKYADLLRTLKKQGHEVGVVVGGGSLSREFIAIAKKLGLNEQAQDEVAISVSRLFAQLFLKKLGEMSCRKVALTLDEAAECLSEGKIMVMGGLKPGITTDAVAAWLKAPIKMASTTKIRGSTRAPLSLTVYPLMICPEFLRRTRIKQGCTRLLTLKRSRF